MQSYMNSWFCNPQYAFIYLVGCGDVVLSCAVYAAYMMCDNTPEAADMIYALLLCSQLITQGRKWQQPLCLEDTIRSLEIHLN
jgi:hypothetical protein